MPPRSSTTRRCERKLLRSRFVFARRGHVVTDRELLSPSGDNFAEFELYKPGAYAYLGTGNPDLLHTMITNHNGGLDVDENAL